MLFLRLAAYTYSINPDPSGPGASGLQRLLDFAGGYGLLLAGAVYLSL